MTSLTKEEQIRYHRQLIIPQVGEEGQEKLKNASVLVIGAGGLGSPVLLYLAAAGVGTIGIVDNDIVDTGNLQRQVSCSSGKDLPAESSYKYKTVSGPPDKG